MSEWPAPLRGVTETVVTTRGPNGLWNLAALGVHAPERSEGADSASGEERPASHAPPRGAERASGDIASTAPATARTFGRTRTWRNFRERGEGYVQFVDDPVTFVEAALSVAEREEPVLSEAAAWARVDVERTGVEERGETRVATWALSPVESRVVREAVPTTNRGYAAVIEATVAASRLDVPGYDSEVLRERLDYFESVCERCGGPREREAFERLRALSG
ncbi:DUF447 family protein [Halarchaeum sp. CBA1220]|uniref:DUF447 domain-containing protein n=1 Tax=Halarchaeum sp. CBA1220 TaxID=1853682 RepID=UPI0015A03851|nr:DUF447 domain-containing protein [Halarchaeum sp. CBA1220]QLC32767.1 DUF447 family protein [Halarchaeum sp. CBA1220]